MLKKLAIGLVIVVLVILALSLLASTHAVTIMINGQEIVGPLSRTAAGLWGFIVSAVALFCVAILLVFVFAGVGIIILGGLVLVGLILAAVMFPFLLPLLIPLLIVWAVVAASRKDNKK
ncbi:MAG: hypothetical protein PHF37_03855 [Phycisphaerae bacterium]|nr:hypothetical protein [Phycisphaerae bacterium]